MDRLTCLKTWWNEWVIEMKISGTTAKITYNSQSDIWSKSIIIRNSACKPIKFPLVLNISSLDMNLLSLLLSSIENHVNQYVRITFNEAKIKRRVECQGDTTTFQVKRWCKGWCKGRNLRSSNHRTCLAHRTWSTLVSKVSFVGNITKKKTKRYIRRLILKALSSGRQKRSPTPA